MGQISAAPSQCELALSYVQTLKIPAITAHYLNVNRGYMSEQQLAKHSGSMVQAYMVERVVLKDYQMLAPVLPQRIKSLLDIGSGIGAIDLVIAKFRNVRQITLVEKRTREVNGRIAFTFSAARQLFEANGFSPTHLQLIDAPTPTTMLEVGQLKYDVILSLRALGFLFPYETYRDVLLKTLVPGGILVIDLVKPGSAVEQAFDEFIRKRFDTVKQPDQVIVQLRKDFGKVTILRDGEDSVRVLVRRTK